MVARQAPGDGEAGLLKWVAPQEGVELVDFESLGLRKEPGHPPRGRKAANRGSPGKSKPGKAPVSEICRFFADLGGTLGGVAPQRGRLQGQELHSSFVVRKTVSIRGSIQPRRRLAGRVVWPLSPLRPRLRHQNEHAGPSSEQDDPEIVSSRPPSSPPDV